MQLQTGNRELAVEFFAGNHASPAAAPSLAALQSGRQCEQGLHSAEEASAFRCWKTRRWQGSGRGGVSRQENLLAGGERCQFGGHLETGA